MDEEDVFGCVRTVSTEKVAMPSVVAWMVLPVGLDVDSPPLVEEVTGTLKATVEVEPLPSGRTVN